jgi:starvation-inducible outer membrane lipoprotein
MKHTILIASIMLTACTADPHGLRKPIPTPIPAYEVDVVGSLINKAEYESQHTTIEVVERDKALNLLNGSY